jgi:hypothetical protein
MQPAAVVDAVEFVATNAAARAAKPESSPIRALRLEPFDKLDLVIIVALLALNVSAADGSLPDLRAA